MLVNFLIHTRSLRKRFVLLLLRRCKRQFLPALNMRKISHLISHLPRPKSLYRKKNACILTHRRRSVFRLLGVSRYVAKKEIELAQIPGLFRASW